MTRTSKTILRASAGIVAVWLAVQLAFDLYPERPGELDPAMELAPARPDMSLREVFETFPGTDGPPKAGLRLLSDNDIAWAARWELLHAAGQRIDVSYFILEQDVVGVAFLGHLLKKAEAGVQVRILLDAFGSKMSWHPTGNDYLDALVNTGNVEVRMFRPLLRRALQATMHLSPSVLVASEHDKILVVDGARSITGGRNIAMGYFADPETFDHAYRDVCVEVSDPDVARALTRAFEAQFLEDSAEPVHRERLNIQSQKKDLDLAYRMMDAWLNGRELPAEATEGPAAAWRAELDELERLRGVLKRPAPPYIVAEARVLDSAVRFNAPGDPISEAVARVVRAARQEIFVQNPYVALSERAVELLAQASERGVPITLFTNSPASGDSAVMQAAFLHQWPWLLARAPTLRLYGSGEDGIILHAKLATIDGTLSLVGTYNLDPLSMAVNSEVVLAVWSPEFAQRLAADARRLLQRGPPYAYRYDIARNPDGTPALDEDRRPVVAYGPADHTSPSGSTTLGAYLWVLETAAAMGMSPFF